jgi:hypothetical protein
VVRAEDIAGEIDQVENIGRPGGREHGGPHGRRLARPARGLAPAGDLHYLEAAVTTLHTTALLLVAAALAGCDERAIASTPDAAPPAPTATSSARPPTAPSASGSAAAEGELKVLKMVFTSEVRQKEPVDKLKSASPGQRVWAHVTMRNRTDATKPIKLAFLVGNNERSKIDLKIDPSWSYRTWGYVTLRDNDVGEVVAEVRDEAGTVMERLRLPIKGDGPAKPQKKASPTDE